MKGAALRRGALRTIVVAGGFAVLPWVLLKLGPPGPMLATGMLALPCSLFAVLRREDRRLSGAAEHVRRGNDNRSGSFGPSFGHFLLRRGR